MVKVSAVPVAERARRIADEVLFPAAMAVDGAQRVPPGHLDLLAGEGLYGLAGPVGYGGLDLDEQSAARIVEILAGAASPRPLSGCSTTARCGRCGPPPTRPARAVAEAALRWRAPGWVALGGALPGAPSLRASAGAWRLSAGRNVALGYRLGHDRHPVYGRPR